MEDLAIKLAMVIMTGAISAFTTVKALGVHITYIRETLNRHEEAITRAHSRIDKQEGQCNGK